MFFVVFGANGQLGKEFTNYFNNNNINYLSLDIKQADITNIISTDTYLQNNLKENDNLIFINAAAYTNVEKAEDDRDNCYLVNVIGSKNLAILTNKYNAKIVYFSTDYVFDGNKNSYYYEYDKVNPLNYYGLTKYLGEEEVKSFSNKYFILRISWLYGKFGNNFVKKMIELGQNKNSLKVVSDQIGTPTSTKDVVLQTMKLVDTDNYGLYHCSNEGETSWFEFTKEIFKIKKIDCTVNSCSSTEFPQKAKRPSFSVIENYNLKLLKLNIMRDWKESLKDFLLNELKG